MKKMMIIAAAAWMSVFFAAGAQASEESRSAADIYGSKCKMCHKIDKKKVGPAFSLMSTDRVILTDKIANGKKMMPKYKNKLTAAEIESMVDFIKSHQAPEVAIDEVVTPATE